VGESNQSIPIGREKYLRVTGKLYGAWLVLLNILVGGLIGRESVSGLGGMWEKSLLTGIPIGHRYDMYNTEQILH
jgi:hypothetical protein